MSRGGNAQVRRRDRRAASRSAALGVRKAQSQAPEMIVAGASGDTGLPLSDRAASWDAGAARKSLKPEQYAAAHFWAVPGGDPKTLAGYKLPFAMNVDGELTAIWRGVTAGAARLSSTQGVDKDAVQAKMTGYYEKAEKQYNDPAIEPPWESPSDEKKENESSSLRASRLNVRKALLAAGIASDAVEPTTTFELTQGSLADRRFLASVIESGYSEIRRGSWPSEATLEDQDEVIFRSENDAVFRAADGTLLYADIGHGWCSVRVSGPSREATADALATFSAKYPPLYREQNDDGTVPVTFWTDGRYGPSSRLRMIDSAAWSAIEANYTASVRDELARLMHDFEPGKEGQLLLWQGSPGTGKTWALRALASEWADWAEFNYITDPDAFFVNNPSYMIDVLLHDSYEELTVNDDVVTSANPGGKWRVLILEDTGELLSANAKEAYGQGLSRLLNVVDGMIGQGLRVLAIVTTNDELGDLHPAVVRPGRCASQMTFTALSAAEATEWLGSKVDHEATLAELYELGNRVPADAFATPMSGKCSDCDHLAEAHGGAMNDGACSMKSCDCGGYETAAVETETAAATPLAQEIEDTIPPDHKPGQKLPPRRPGPKVPDFVRPARADGTLTWTATLAPEGKATDDGRVFAPGSITWRELPLSLMAMTKTADGHDGAEVAGRIDRIWREGGLIRAEGVFDSGDFGQEIARLVTDGTLRGVSVDIAPQKVEVGYRSSVVDDDGNWKEDAAEAGSEPEPRSLVDMLLGNPDEEVIYIVREAVLGMATVCPFQAFADATIETESSLVSDASPMVWTITSQAGWRVIERGGTSPEPVPAPDAEPLTASAAGLAPTIPPLTWFDDPEFEELTALTVSPDGRVYGHAAAWGTCHIGITGVCRTAPNSNTNYAYFHLKEVECEDGERVNCGTITLDTGHADHALGRVDAARHYDNTGTAVADVICGEDDYGIWVAGALRSDVDAETARKLSGAVLSGDWRNVNGNLELVALLAVNVPGFPVPRTSAMLASGDGGFHVESLVAVGLHQGLGGLTAEQRAQFDALRDVARGEWGEIQEFVNAA